MQQFKGELFAHPPNSLDLAQTDFHLSLMSRNSCVLNNSMKMKIDVLKWLKSKVVDSIKKAKKAVLWKKGVWKKQQL